MAGEWRTSTWGEEVSLEYGRSLRGYDASKGQYRVFGSNGPIGWTALPLAPGPGVILGRKGAYRGVQYSPDPFFVIDTAYYVVPKTELDMRWLYYAIKHYNLGEVDDGSPIPSTTRAAVYVMDMEVPPINEQRAIAHILGTLDDKIELNRKMNQTLEAMARAIFKSWFVDFDPVRAKAEGRDPGLPADLAALFPDSFEDSEFGEIPKGWKVLPVGEALKAVGGSTPSTVNPAFWNAGEFHWATPKDLSGLSSPILIGTERKINRAGVEQISSGLLPVGTLLMSSRAPVGYLALNTIPVAVNQGFIAMICDGPVSNYYVLNWCQYNMEEIQQRASGTTFAEISKAAFRPIPMIVPADTIMKRFTEIVDPFYKSITERLKETRTLAALRDALLPKLLSGEIRVKVANAVGGAL